MGVEAPQPPEALYFIYIINFISYLLIFPSLVPEPAFTKDKGLAHFARNLGLPDLAGREYYSYHVINKYKQSDWFSRFLVMLSQQAQDFG